MIKEIRVENFRGITKERKISFLANSKRIKNKDGVYKTDFGEILLAVGIMGKNASGKSSFLEAIEFFKNLVFDYLYDAEYRMIKHFNEKNKKEKNKLITLEDVMAQIKGEYFLDKQKNVKIGITLVDKKNKIDWNVSLSNKGEVLENILYNKEEYKQKARIDKFKTKMLEKEIKFKLINFYFYQTIASQNFSLRQEHYYWSYNWDFSKKITKNMVLNWIRIADEKIMDFGYDQKAKSIKNFSIKQDNKINRISWDDLSSGTRRWMNLGKIVLRMLLEKQGFLFVDEIETKLHPSLTRFIVNMFANKKINKMKSQILFTSHSPLVVDNPFRKDAIYYFEDDEVVNLGNDFKVREDFSFVKNFLNEKLGSHPSKPDMFYFLEDIDE